MKKKYLSLALLAVLLASCFSYLYIQVINLNQALDDTKKTQLEMNSEWQARMTNLESLLESKIKALQNENTLLTENLNDLKIRNKALNETLAMLNDTQTRIVSELENKINDLQTKNLWLNGKLIDLKTANELLNESLNVLNRRLTMLNESQQMAISELESRIKTLEANNSVLNDTVSTLESQNAQLNETLNLLEERIESLNESLTILSEAQTITFIVYPKDGRFYAINDGEICCNETDAYQVIQYAINQTIENGGGTVFLKEGVYPINKTIVLMEGVSLFGSGEQSTVLVATSPITMVRTIRNNYAEIKHIHLDMNYTANVGIVISDTYYNDIHIAVTHLKELSTGVHVGVTQNELGCFYNKIWANIEGNQSIWSTGIYLTSSVNVTPNFNYFSGNIRNVDMGMLIARGKEEIVEHMDVEGCKRTGYYIEDNRSLFINCYSEGNGEYGYYLRSNTYTTIIGGYKGGNQLRNFEGETGSQYIIIGGDKMRFIVWTESGKIQTALYFENSSMVIYNELTNEPLFKIYPSGDVELCQAGVGIILRSENGTTYRVYVDNDGNLQIEPYP